MEKMSKKQMFVLIGQLMVLLITVSSTVNAYVLTGDTWPSNKLDPLWFYHSSGYSVVDDAVDDWNDENHDGGDLTEYGDPEYCWLYIIKVTQTVAWAGKTALVTQSGDIIAGDISLNSYWFDTWQDGERLCTTSHEIGHAWGLNHENDEYEGALMHGNHTLRWDDWGINTPQDDDIDGVNAAY